MLVTNDELSNSLGLQRNLGFLHSQRYLLSMMHSIIINSSPLQLLFFHLLELLACCQGYLFNIDLR